MLTKHFRSELFDDSVNARCTKNHASVRFKYVPHFQMHQQQLVLWVYFCLFFVCLVTSLFIEICNFKNMSYEKVLLKNNYFECFGFFFLFFLIYIQQNQWTKRQIRFNTSSVCSLVFCYILEILVSLNTCTEMIKLNAPNANFYVYLSPLKDRLIYTY